MPESKQQEEPAKPDPWITIGRIGYFGPMRERAKQFIYSNFGDIWRSGHWIGKCVSKEESVTHYEESYIAYLRDNPDVLDWLCRTASDVYDTEPENVNSGFSYDGQDDAKPSHRQDIAIRKQSGPLAENSRGITWFRFGGKKARATG